MELIHYRSPLKTFLVFLSLVALNIVRQYFRMEKMLRIINMSVMDVRKLTMLKVANCVTKRNTEDLKSKGDLLSWIMVTRSI